MKKHDLIRGISVIVGFMLFKQLIEPIIIVTAYSLSDNITLAYTSGIISNIVVVLILLYLYRDDYKEKSQFNFKNLSSSFWIYILGLVVTAFINFILMYVLKLGESANEVAVSTSLSVLPLYSIASILIFAPIIEEYVFRRGLFDIVKNKWLYITLSGLLFGSMHVVFHDPTFIDLLFILPYSILGMSFGYIYYKYRDINLTISIHFFNNLLALLAMVLMYV